MIALSYSLLDKFHNVCRRQTYHLYVKRDVKSTYTAASQGGVDQHAAIEAALKRRAALPPELGKLAPVMASLTAPGLKRAVEVKLGADHRLEPCDFFGHAVRWRGVPDLVAYRPEAGTALLIDWKTGKPRDNALQHRLNAALVFTHYPVIHKIKAGNFYTKTARMGETSDFERADLPMIWASLETLARPFETAVKATDPWPARQGPLCKWCPVKSCEYNRSDEL